MITKREYLKAVMRTLFFLIIGWLLMIPLNIFFLKIDLKSWAYIVIQIIYMVLAGILICFTVNRKTLSSKVVFFQKNRKYYRMLATQLLVWLIIGILVVVSELFKLNYFSNFLWNLSTIISPQNPRDVLSVFLSVGIYVLLFIFITIMGMAYSITKYIFDKSTEEQG